MMIRTFAAACLLALCASAAAHPAIDAIAAADRSTLHELHFRTVQTSTTRGKTSTTVASFDPSASTETRWTLESIDGRAPSNAETTDFRKRKKNADNSKLADLIDPASLTPLDTGSQQRRWRFRFREGKELEGISLAKFSGLVTLGEGGQASAIDLILDESVRIKAVVKIARMRQHVEYARLSNGSVVERSMDMEMEGSAVMMTLKLSSHTSYELIQSPSGS